MDDLNVSNPFPLSAAQCTLNSPWSIYSNMSQLFANVSGLFHLGFIRDILQLNTLSNLHGGNGEKLQRFMPFKWYLVIIISMFKEHLYALFAG